MHINMYCKNVLCKYKLKPAGFSSRCSQSR